MPYEFSTYDYILILGGYCLDSPPHIISQSYVTECKGEDISGLNR